MHKLKVLPLANSIVFRNGFFEVPGGEDIQSLAVCKRDGRIKNPEGYCITADEQGISLRASTDAGFFYARKTLEQLAMQYGKKIPYMTVADEPRFEHRGFMIDCARHMFGVDELKAFIEAAASFKFNKFHWHLSDDQGFRIKLDKYPLLTGVGARRKCDNFGKILVNNTPYKGYYTKEQVREIVDFCSQRFIQVIPEIDMPGHATAMLAAYPEYSCTGERVEVETRNGIFGNTLCLSKEKTASFAFDILDEIAELFPGDTIHIGGDETKKGKWKDCPHCQKLMEEKGFESTEQLQSYFTNRLVEHLKEKGKKAIVWNEALAGDKLDDSVTAQLWLDPKGNSAKWANRGNKVVISDFFRYYADYPYEMTPLKKTYSFEPTSEKGFDDVGKRNVIGVETPIWTEFIDNFEKLGEQCFPRFLAVAESGWTGREYKNYEDFQSRVWFVKPIVNNLGIDYAPSVQWNVSGGKRFSGTLKFCTKLIAKPGKKHG